jgi:hypothetical protein
MEKMMEHYIEPSVTITAHEAEPLSEIAQRRGNIEDVVNALEKNMNCLVVALAPVLMEQTPETDAGKDRHAGSCELSEWMAVQCDRLENVNSVIIDLSRRVAL